MPLQIAWRILTHQKGRTALAIGGIFVAILLIFVELGFFIAVPQGGMLIYDHMRFDLLLVSDKYIFQSESWQLPRARLTDAAKIAEVAQADLYHFDNWRPICKAFLYLTDVSEENAPFVYIPGTHKPASWKRRHEIAYDVYGMDGPFGHFLPQEVRALRREFDWEDLVCTGDAGALILADLRGLHRGIRNRRARRIGHCPVNRAAERLCIHSCRER